MMKTDNRKIAVLVLLVAAVTGIAALNASLSPAADTPALFDALAIWASLTLIAWAAPIVIGAAIAIAVLSAIALV